MGIQRRVTQMAHFVIFVNLRASFIQVAALPERPVANLFDDA